MNINNTLDNLNKDLRFYNARTKIIAQNLANTDTPNYKAMDIVKNDEKSATLPLNTTHPGHFSITLNTMLHSQGYREEQRGMENLDGNTVNADEERMHFTENAMMTRLKLLQIERAVDSYKSAISGGNN